MSTEILTQQELKDVLHYDPDTGVFTRIKSCRGHKAGKVVGAIQLTGYWAIQLFGIKYYAHRLAFLYMKGKLPNKEVDHLNRKRADNRWCNLKQASSADNSKNMTKRCDNTSGYTGVYPDKRFNNGKWRISVGKTFRGGFETKGDAIRARKKEELDNGYVGN